MSGSQPVGRGSGTREGVGALEFRLLGPLTVYRAGRPVDVGAARPQAMLATMLLAAPAARTKQFLLDGVWGEHGPRSGERIVPAYAYALRKALDLPGTPSESSVLRWDGTGYRIAVDAGSTDLGVFAARTEQARLARGRDEPARARQLLADALLLYTGEPLAGLPGPFLEAQRQRLQELRLSTVEQRVELDLHLGRHHEIVAELQELVAEHPLREGLAANLMLALHRSGRRAEALSRYAKVRAMLVGELGIEPGAQLQLAQREVLAATHLDEAAPVGVAAPAWVSRCDLPAQRGPEFVGRQAELARLLDGTRAAPRVDTISGMPGVGKTTLALRAGYLLAGHYPDGQLYLDLHGHATHRLPAEPAVALERLLTAVGVPAAAIPDGLDARAALWRARTARRRVLLVLDDVRAAAQVRPLLPGGSGCRVLITARTALADLDAGSVPLSPFDDADAVALLGGLGVPGHADPGAARRIAHACGGLPLALRVAAARLRSRPGWTVTALADRLDGAPGRLDELAVGDLDVRAALGTQVAELSVAQARVFHRLGELPAEFGRAALHTATAPDTAGADTVDAAGAAATLDDLVELNLVQQRGPDRFALPELLRCYARTMPAPLGRGPRVVSLREPADRGPAGGFDTPPGMAG